MYKSSIDLTSVNNSMKLKFCLVTESDVTAVNKYGTKLVNKFSMNGNDYLKFNPHPYITIDITSRMDRKEEWTSNRTVNLNKRDLFKFISNLRLLVTEFKQQRGLYYFKGNKLMVDNNIALSITKAFKVSSKVVRFQPCVVPDEENEAIEYEGCVMCINSMANFCYLTYDEMEYLLFELMNLDMYSLTMSLMQLTNTYKDIEKSEVQKPPVQEVKEDTNKLESSGYVRIERPSTIPDL